MLYKAQSQAITVEADRERVAQALTDVAISVLQEAGSVVGHATRAAYASQVLANPAHHGMLALRVVCTTANAGAAGATDPLKDNAAGDAALKAVIVALWNALAGYSPADVTP